MTAGSWVALVLAVLVVAGGAGAFLYVRSLDWKRLALKERERADAEAEAKARASDLDAATDLSDDEALRKLQENRRSR